jgi:diacylglycerol kinase (ATP)
MKVNSFSIKARSRSFRYAFNGIYKFFLHEPNAVLHFIATIAVFAGIFYFNIQRSEIVVLVLATGFVWVAEIFNTAIERIMDVISPEWRSETGLIKDLSAGAVLLSALTAAITGAIIFIPKIF